MGFLWEWDSSWGSSWQGGGKLGIGIWKTRGWVAGEGAWLAA